MSIQFQGKTAYLRNTDFVGIEFLDRLPLGQFITSN